MKNNYIEINSEFFDRWVEEMCCRFGWSAIES